MRAKRDEPLGGAGRVGANLGVCPWIDSLEQCSGKGRERDGPHKANGAGIAADPTLTGVWMTFPLPMPPANLRRLSLQGHAWRPMSSLPLPAPCGRPFGRFVTGARAGIRLSLRLALRVRHLAWAFRLSPPRLCFRRDRVPLPSANCCGWGLTPFRCICLRARFPACPVPSFRSGPWI